MYMDHVITLLLFLLPFHLLLFKAAHSKCQESFPCGNYNLSFPFTKADNSGCRLITVDGCDSDSDSDSDSPYPVIHFGGGNLDYYILENNTANKVLISDLQLGAQLQNRSCFSFMNQSMLRPPSISTSFSPNLTLFPCLTEPGTNKSKFDGHFENYSKIDCISIVYYKIPTADDSASEKIGIPRECSLVQLPLSSSRGSGDLFNMITANFSLEWTVSEECLSCFHG